MDIFFSSGGWFMVFTYIVITLLVGSLLVWLYTPSGKRWLANL